MNLAIREPAKAETSTKTADTSERPTSTNRLRRTATRRGPRSWIVAAGVTAVSLVGLQISVASAAVSGSITPGASTINPGASTSIGTSFSETTPILPGTFVSIIVTPGAGATGSVVLSSPDRTGDVNGCDVFSPTRVDCLWTSGGTAGTVLVTATASSDATGPFLITTTVTGVDPDNPTPPVSVERPVAGPVTLNVVLPPTTSTTAPPPSSTAPPTTSTPTPTTTSPAAAAPSTTAAPSAGTGGTLPATGPSTPWTLAAVAATLLATGGCTIVIARRGRRDDMLDARPDTPATNS